MVDYAIARKIIDLHRNVVRGSDAKYTQAEVLKYVMFGKQFKPVISVEAGELLVKYYTQLRQREGPSAAKAMYRITVRQLESMIRLSEAQAKMECTETVSRQMCLLSKSESKTVKLHVKLFIRTACIFKFFQTIVFKSSWYIVW